MPSELSQRDTHNGVPGRPEFSLTTDPLLQSRYRALTRKHLEAWVARLFHDFTGLHLRIAWMPSSPCISAAVAPDISGVMCRGLSNKPSGDCLGCGPKHLARALLANGLGHHFECRRGARNYWLPIRVRAVTVGIAYVQAINHGMPAAAPARGKGYLRRADFYKASRLLRLIVQHVQTLNLAELSEMDLTLARHAVTALTTEKAQLSKELRRGFPASPLPAGVGAETRSNQIVRCLVHRASQHYAQPITLRQFAREFGMNLAYLSDLFSRAVGIPFKAYLTELRLQRARELLKDPKRTVSEVAGSVGYASENRFRIAFKKATGLPPRTWRETFRAGQHT